MRKRKLMNNNKGFSLVELIIVIAILAILAGALAPQLIKYIDSSRKSTDVQNGQAIATAVNVALANEDAYNQVMDKIDSGTTTAYWVSECYDGDGNSKSSDELNNCFLEKVVEVLGANQPKPKYRGQGNTPYDDFVIVLDNSSGLSFKIYPGVTDDGDSYNDNDELYPNVGSNYID